MTTLYLDTCECKVAYQETPPHEVTEWVRCSIHEALPDVENLGDVPAIQENRLRNDFLFFMKQEHFELMEEYIPNPLTHRDLVITAENRPLLSLLGVTSEDVNTRIKASYPFSFDLNRNLKLERLNATQKTAVRTSLDARFNRASKVILP